MQPKLGESAGSIGGGYEVVIINDEVCIDPPAGSWQQPIFVPEYSVIICTLDKNYFFIASALGSKSPNAKVWRVDLENGRYTQYVLPNNTNQIMSHIHQYSPGVQNRDPFYLTGEGQIMSLGGRAVLVCFVSSLLLGAIVLLVIWMRYRFRHSKTRRLG